MGLSFLINIVEQINKDILSLTGGPFPRPKRKTKIPSFLAEEINISLYAKEYMESKHKLHIGLLGKVQKEQPNSL